ICRAKQAGHVSGVWEWCRCVPPSSTCAGALRDANASALGARHTLTACAAITTSATTRRSLERLRGRRKLSMPIILIRLAAMSRCARFLAVAAQPVQHARIRRGVVIPLWRLDDHGDALEALVVHQPAEWFLAQRPFANELVPIAPRCEWRLGVVEMHYPQPVDTNGVSEPGPDARIVVDEIITGREDVTRVETHAEPLLQRGRHASENRGQLLERRAEHRSGSCGGLHAQYRTARHLFQACGDGIRVARDAAAPVVHVVPRMRHEEIQLERFAPLQLGNEGLHGALAQGGVGTGQIDQIRIVRYGDPDIRVRERGPKGLYFLLVADA